MKASSVYLTILKKALLAVAFFVAASAAFSQEMIKISGAKGGSYIVGDISENQARQNAINEAKIDALKKANIEEHINSYQALFSSQINNDFTQFFNSDIQSEIQGAVSSYSITREEKKVNKGTNIIEYEVTIDATVIKYNTKKDISFIADIEGIKRVYNHGDKLTFTLKTSKDCYLTVFCITDHDASLMYPNILEKEQFIEKEREYKFPYKSELLDYELETNNKEETNRLIFVLTKQKIPYINFKGDSQLTESEKIFSWVYSIPPDQRYVIFNQLRIVN